MPFLLLLFCILGELVSSDHEKYYNTYMPEEPTGKKFSELYGINKKEREEITEMIYQMNHPEKYPKQPIGFLLKGKPGNGKSFLAEAIAKEIKGRDNRSARIIKASGSSFINLYVGVGQGNVKRLFQAAKKNVGEIENVSSYQFHWDKLLNFQNPFVFNDPRSSLELFPRRTIIIIDEISAIPKRTECPKHSEDYKVITELLYQFDELNRTQNQNIKIIATTNDAKLDEALIRSGRLETEIEIGDPTEETITEIIEHHPFIKQIKRNDYLNVEIKEKYEFIPTKYIESCLESYNQNKLIHSLTSIVFAHQDVTFATVDIYSILDRAFTKINDPNNKLHPIEVLLKLIHNIMYKSKNQGKDYLKNEAEKKIEDSEDFTFTFIEQFTSKLVNKINEKEKEKENLNFCSSLLEKNNAQQSLIIEKVNKFNIDLLEKTNEQMMNNTKELIKILATEMKEIKKTAQQNSQEERLD